MMMGWIGESLHTHSLCLSVFFGFLFCWGLPWKMKSWMDGMLMLVVNRAPEKFQGLNHICFREGVENYVVLPVIPPKEE